MQTDLVKAGKTTGLARRSELQEALQQLTNAQPGKLDRSTRCLVSNGTGGALEAFSVLEVTGSLGSPANAKDLSRVHRLGLSGNTPSADDLPNVVITQHPVSSGIIATAAAAGVTVVRLTGDAGKSYATVKSAATALESADNGDFVILYDEADDDGAYAPGERYALIRFNQRLSTGGSGGGSGAVECCDGVVSRGAVTLFSLEWATDYTVQGSALGDFTITDQGSGTWESPTLVHTCGGAADDDYLGTMVVSSGSAAGIPAGAIVLTIDMETGGGAAGVAACCNDSAGFVHKFTNPEFIANPLAGFKFKTMQDGTSGNHLDCEPTVCEVCVVPNGAASICADSIRERYRIDFESGESGFWVDALAAIDEPVSHYYNESGDNCNFRNVNSAGDFCLNANDCRTLLIIAFKRTNNSGVCTIQAIVTFQYYINDGFPPSNPGFVNYKSAIYPSDCNFVPTADPDVFDKPLNIVWDGDTGGIPNPYKSDSPPPSITITPGA